LGYVACAVEHRDDGQRIAGRVVHDQVGVHAPELQWTIGEILADVADAWPRRQQVGGREQRVTNANGSVLVVGSNELYDVADVLLRQTESAGTRP
jgi:hypothetical protein